jgi:hypothetical protein
MLTISFALSTTTVLDLETGEVGVVLLLLDEWHLETDRDVEAQISILA